MKESLDILQDVGYTQHMTQEQELKNRITELEGQLSTGDRFGNMGPGTRMVNDRLRKEINAAGKELRQIEYAKPPAKVGIVCSLCNQDIGIEGESQLAENDGYTGCCNEPTI